MTTSIVAPPLSPPIPSVPKKKRVLLIDTSQSKRDLRAEAMRKLGVEVDCAADIAEARSWWKAAFYDLVLINMGEGAGHRDRFCEDVRSATPPQKLAFLVGKPEYVADSPGADEEFVVEDSNRDAVLVKAKAVIASDFGGVPQRWGILEASQRISAVRSASVARTQALRNIPAPPRDYEARSAKSSTPATLDDLLREEMQ
jgi:CheY-like chemotaxis protein